MPLTQKLDYAYYLIFFKQLKTVTIIFVKLLYCCCRKIF